MAGNRDRQRRIARERYRRQQELRSVRRQRVRKRTLVALSVLAACGLVAGLILVFIPSSTPKPTASATSTPKPTATASASATPSASTVAEPAHHCTYTAATPIAKNAGLPSAAPDYAASYTATIKTNVGDISVNLLNSKATCTVNSFVHLAETGYFNNTQCHRLLTSGIYVLQCGDAYAAGNSTLSCSSANNKVGSGTPGYQYASENLTGATYPAGVVAMANNGTATTNGSQFFIVYKDSTAGLSASYTPFATVSSGLNIVQNVAKDGFSCQYPSTEGGGVPKEKFIIDSVTIKKT